MGKYYSRMRNPFRNFNVESRAHKAIEREKPLSAPRHKGDQLNYDRVMKEHPQIYKDSLKKNPELDTFLKNVYIKSHDPELQQKPAADPTRPLPLERRSLEDCEYGIKEPEKVPVGKATLRQALQFITDHQNDRRRYTVEKIAEDYLIPIETVENILKHYKVFEVYFPEQRKVKAKFAGPSIPRLRVTPTQPKLLPGKKDET